MNETDEAEKIKDLDNPLTPLLRDSPNSLMDSFTFFEMLQDSAVDNGNAFAYIGRTKSKRILSLTPLLYDRMKFKILPSGSVGYTYSNEDGSRDEYTQNDIFHLRYRTKDGVTGISPIRAAPEVFGGALAIQTHSNATFENGAFQHGMLKVPFDFDSEEARKNFVDSFKNILGGKNAGKVGLLEKNAEWVKIAQDNVAAQLLGLREHSVLEVCRLLRVPPVFAQVMDKGMAFASVEQFAILFIQYTIQPWVTRWERAIKFQLLNGATNSDRFVRFNINALLRGDLKSRTDAVVAALGAGLKTINEGRHLLDDNRLKDPLADEILFSNNLRPARTVAAADAPKTPVDNPATDAVPDNEVPNDVADTAERARAAAAELKLIDSLVGRLIRRELEQLKTASTKRSDFVKWAEEFYPKHCEMMRETLEPACEVVHTKACPDILKNFLDSFVASRADHLKSGGTGEQIVARIKADSDKWAKQLYEQLDA